MEFKTAAGNNSSISNEMLFVVYDSKSTDPTTYPDYAYVCDVYVNDELKARLISRPYPDTNMGVFDVSKVLMSYVEYGFKISTDIEDYDTRLAYKLKIGEQYDGTIYTNVLEDSNDRYAKKTYAIKPYLTSAILSNGLASDMPSTITQFGNPVNYLIIPYFSDVSGVTDLTVTYKDKNGNTLNTATLSNADFTANKIRQFNIENSDEDTAYALFTGPFSLQVNYECSKYEVQTLVWLNKYGGYESQTFGMVSKKTIELDRKAYTQKDYQINASGVVSYSSNNVYYGGKKGYYTVVNTKMNMTSHLLSKEEYDWLADLFRSPDVYISDENNSYFIPVTIIESNYEHRNYGNSRLTPLNFSVEFTSKYNSQQL